MTVDMSEDILFEKHGVAGVITLNRPQAMNAITDAMFVALDDALSEWERDTAVKRVVIRANGKAFSAGGDIRALYEAGLANRPDIDFFAREYRLNHRVATYPKPYIALVDGIAMGGGVGVSFHGSTVVAGPNAVFAMPEVGIGFFPDVGACHFLSRLAGQVGLYLGLTGEREGQADLLWTGLADVAVSDTDALLADLTTTEPLDEILARHSQKLRPGSLATHAAHIADAFGATSVGAIANRLETLAVDLPFAAQTLDAMNRHSPTSLAVTHRQITTARGLDLAGCLEMDFRIVLRMLHGDEFYEGIRAAVIDKDRAPRWQPPTLAEVTVNMVDAYFAPLDDPLKLS